MAHRPLSLFLILSLGTACLTDSEPSTSTTCDEVVAHAAGLRADARLEHVPASELDGHRAAMAAALAPTLRAACARMTEADRACWGQASSAADLAGCATPTADDATALARAPRTPIDPDAPAPPPHLDLLAVEP